MSRPADINNVWPNELVGVGPTRHYELHCRHCRISVHRLIAYEMEKLITVKTGENTKTKWVKPVKQKLVAEMYWNARKTNDWFPNYHLSKITGIERLN